VSGDTDNTISLGSITGVWGVKGWVKVHSFTDPRENIVSLPRWILSRNGTERVVDVVGGRVQGKTVVAQLDGVTDRDMAAGLIGATIAVARGDLPECAPGEFYWADLEGMRVQDRQGNLLGTVERMLETGAHDVMVLSGESERLIPFVLGDIVENVDSQAGIVTVSWDASYWDD